MSYDKMTEAEKAAEEWAIYIKCYTGANEWVDLVDTALNKFAVQAFLAGAAWAARETKRCKASMEVEAKRDE